MLELMCELLGELVWSTSGVDQKFYSGEDFSSKVKLSSTSWFNDLREGGG